MVMKSICLMNTRPANNAMYNCNRDEAILEKFKRIQYHKKNGELIKSKLLHSLLKCTTCQKLWNRDVNSARNQRDLAHMVNTKTSLSLSNAYQSGLTTPETHKFTPVLELEKAPFFLLMNVALKQSEFRPFSITTNCPCCAELIRTEVRRIEQKQLWVTKKYVVHSCPRCDFVLAEVVDDL
jgi:hypothetical protein